MTKPTPRALFLAAVALVLGCPPKDDTGMESGIPEDSPRDSSADSPADSRGDSLADSEPDSEPDTGPPDDPALWIELDQADARFHSDMERYDAGRFLDLGDSDADGVLDLAVSAMWAESRAGGAYLIPGPLEGERTLEDAGHFLVGDELASGAGRSLSMGDATGDGYSDVMIGSPYTGASSAWLIPGPIQEDLLISGTGLRLSGVDDTLCGHGSDLADLDGDGVDDAVVGAYTSDGGAGSGSGAVFVRYGPVTDHHHLPDEADGVLLGADGATYTGKIVVAGGDLDGDGLSDLLVPSMTETAGVLDSSVYAVTDAVLGSVEIEDSPRIDSINPNDKAGSSLAMGDLDGDGLDDLALGSWGTGAVPAAAYVFISPVDPRLLTTQADATVVETDTTDELGFNVAVGDRRGTPARDLVVASHSAVIGDLDKAGAVHLFAGPLSGTYELDQAAVSIPGESAGATLGQGLLLQDLDNDGLGDLVLGAPMDSSLAEQGGAVYALLGAGALSPQSP